MSRRPAIEIFSIFGQIEEVAATIMLKKGEITRIEPKDIPPTVAVNDLGQRAKFAVMVPANKVHAFNELIADLRA